MNDEKKPIKNPEWLITPFKEEVLVYSVAGEQALYLNQAAYTVWQLCDTGMKIGDMIQYLEEAYPGQKARIRMDVYATLRMLQSKGAIELADE